MIAAVLLAVPSAEARAGGGHPAAKKPAPVLRVAPVLDAAKGREAKAAFLRELRRVCRHKRIGHRDRVRFGTPSDPLDAKPRSNVTCQPPLGAHAIASGALTRAGADEVLLTTSGPGRLGGPADEDALALMRREKGAYRFVGMWLTFEGELTARRRLTTGPGRADQLVLCFVGGRQGVYPGECGFFGQGAFQRYGQLYVDTSEVPIGDVEDCGPGVSISLQKIALDGDLLRFSLVVKRYTRVAKNADDDACTVEHVRSRQGYRIDYRFDGGRFVRTARLPAGLAKVVDELGQ